MKKRFLLYSPLNNSCSITLGATIILLLFSIKVFPQSSCLPEGITFTTHEQVDSFQVNYPGCTEIEGDVIISGENITSLQGLNVVTNVGGFL